MAWLILLSLLAHQPRQTDVLVLCPLPFQRELVPWVDYRQRQGYSVLVLTPAKTAFGIKQQIKEVARGGGLRNLLIIGDAVNDVGQGDQSITVTDYRLAQVIQRYGGDRDIATDTSYADIDNDGLPDLTVGRLPVDTPEQLRVVIRKIIDYENSPDFGTWRRKINLIAGVGNFGAIVDDVIEKTTRRLITDLVPSSYETSVTIASWQSPFCPAPQRINSVVVDKLNEGCLFWVYIGHGLPDSVATMDVGRHSFPVFDSRHVRQVHARHGMPIAIFLACYNGAFDSTQDCLGEDLMRQPAGPIACIGGSRMTMPYGLAKFSCELMQQFSAGSTETLGELLLQAKRAMIAESDGQKYRELIGTLGEAMSPTPDLLRQEELEHIQMMHLLGDPLLRIDLPHTLHLDVAQDALEPGAVIDIQGTASAGGELTVELCYNRDRLRCRPPRRREFDLSNEAALNYDLTYQAVNDLTCVQRQFQVAAGPFSVQLPVPVDASGPCHVRGFLKSENQAWSQAVPVMLR